LEAEVYTEVLRLDAEPERRTSGRRASGSILISSDEDLPSPRDSKRIALRVPRVKYADLAKIVDQDSNICGLRNNQELALVKSSLQLNGGRLLVPVSFVRSFLLSLKVLGVFVKSDRRVVRGGFYILVSRRTVR
jgi:hypothetical protein